MTDRIKLEDMTSREIVELKCAMAFEIQIAIIDVMNKFDKSYDVGDVDLTVRTAIQDYKDGYGRTCAPSQISYDVLIKFSKEDETY